jgi:hypothetical protein
MKAEPMPAVRICPLPGDGLGPLGGPFTVESVTESAGADPQAAGASVAGLEAAGPPRDSGPQDDVVATVVQFGRWISRGMSYYQNKGGIEDSSLFKSFAAECFEELTRDAPEAAAQLTGLTVICRELAAAVADDPTWRLHRAILATLPGVRFVE